MRKIIILLLIFVFSGTGILQAEYMSLNYEGEAFFDNSHFPVNDLLRDDYSSLSTDVDKFGEFIEDMEERWFLKLGSHNYFIGYIREHEREVKVDGETIIFLTERFNDNEKYSQKEYKLDLNTLYQRLEGIVFGGQILPDNDYGMSLILKGKLLEGLELTYRDYEGKISESNEKYYVSGTRKGLYSNLTEETEMYDVTFDSLGYSLGYDFNWQLRPELNLKLEAENFYSKIEWEDVYGLEMEFNNSSLGMYTNISSTSNNTVSSQSQGEYSYRNYTTSLTPEYNLALQTARSKLGLFYRKKLYPYFNFKLLDGPIVIKPGIYSKFYTLGLAYKGLKIKLMSRNLDIFSSEGVGVQVDLEVGF